jgi:hypothetical protein
MCSQPHPFCTLASRVFAVCAPGDKYHHEKRGNQNVVQVFGQRAEADCREGDQENRCEATDGDRGRSSNCGDETTTRREHSYTVRFSYRTALFAALAAPSHVLPIFAGLPP